MLQISSFYLPVLAIAYFALSINVIRIRRSISVALGDGDNISLKKAIRAHGNFFEYVPFISLLLCVAELKGQSVFFINLYYLILILGRGLHFYSITRKNEVFKFRVAGMLLTFSSLLGASFLILFN